MVIIFVSHHFQPLSGRFFRLFRRRLPQIIRAVPVHIYFSYHGRKTALFQQIHKQNGSFFVDCGENTGSCGGTFSHLFCKDAICFFRIFQILVFCLFRKCIDLQPFKKLHIHSKSPERILRSMNMEICKSRNDQPIPHIFYRDTLKCFWKYRINSLNFSVFTNEITLFVYTQFFTIFCVYNISF